MRSQRLTQRTEDENKENGDAKKGFLSKNHHYFSDVLKVDQPTWRRVPFTGRSRIIPRKRRAATSFKTAVAMAYLPISLFRILKFSRIRTATGSAVIAMQRPKKKATVGLL